MHSRLFSDMSARILENTRWICISMLVDVHMYIRQTYYTLPYTKYMSCRQESRRVTTISRFQPGFQTTAMVPASRDDNPADMQMGQLEKLGKHSPYLVSPDIDSWSLVPLVFWDTLYYIDFVISWEHVKKICRTLNTARPEKWHVCRCYQMCFSAKHCPNFLKVCP